MTDQEVEFTIADKDEAAEKAQKVWFVKELVDSTQELSDEERELLTEAIYAWLNDDLDEDPDADSDQNA